MTNDQCSCANDCEVTCIVHPTPRSMKERIAELEAELTKARDNVVGTRRIFHQYLRKTKEVRLLCLELEVENRRLREENAQLCGYDDWAEMEALAAIMDREFDLRA